MAVIETRSCKYCAEPLVKKPGETDRAFARREFCTRKCSGKYWGAQWDDSIRNMDDEIGWLSGEEPGPDVLRPHRVDWMIERCRIVREKRTEEGMVVSEDVEQRITYEEITFSDLKWSLR